MSRNSTDWNNHYDIDCNGCWIWKGMPDADGYGRVTIGQRKTQAHAYFYRKYKGPIPVGLQIDHLCRVRMCVNPDHLEAVTSKINNNRGTRWPLNRRRFFRYGGKVA